MKGGTSEAPSYNFLWISHTNARQSEAGSPERSMRKSKKEVSHQQMGSMRSFPHNTAYSPHPRPNACKASVRLLCIVASLNWFKGNWKTRPLKTQRVWRIEDRRFVVLQIKYRVCSRLLSRLLAGAVEAHIVPSTGRDEKLDPSHFISLLFFPSAATTNPAAEGIHLSLPLLKYLLTICR